MLGSKLIQVIIPIIVISATIYINIMLQNQSVPQNYFIESNKKKKPRYAFATLVTPAFCMGAVALAHTLQKYHGEKYGMLCLVTPDVNNTWVEILQQWWEVIKVPNFKPKSNFRRSWAKLFLWDQIQYDKLVYFDSDILIFNPVDELFQYPQLSCASDPSPPQICNTGVLVIEPKSGLLNRMQAASKIDGNVMGIGDQAFINFFFNGFTPLPPKFNILRIQTRGLSFAIKNNLTKAVHYVCKKPWKCGRQETCGCGYPSFNQKWWDIWDEACANHKCIESWSE